MPSPASRPTAGLAGLIGLVVFLASVAFGVMLGGSHRNRPEITATAPSQAVEPSATPSPSMEEEPQEDLSFSPTATAVEPSPTRVYQEREIKRQSTTTYRLAEITGGAPKGRTLAVVVQKGLPIDPDQASRIIIDTLNDRRGWAGLGHGFTLVKDPAEADLQIAITSPAVTDQECKPLRTHSQVSCTPDLHHVFLNSDRWLYGVPHVPDLAQYRRYVVSHEVGHSLGRRHVPCPGAGKPAPVMLQQTYKDRLGQCTPNEWVTVA